MRAILTGQMSDKNPRPELPASLRYSLSVIRTKTSQVKGRYTQGEYIVDHCKNVEWPDGQARITCRTAICLVSARANDNSEQDLLFVLQKRAENREDGHRETTVSRLTRA